MTVNSEMVKTIVLNIAKTIEENKQYLTDLDAAIGDGDHGSNLNKGFLKAEEKLNSSEFNTIGDILKAVATTLISNVGGASGPLYGTFFLKAGTFAKDMKEMDFKDFCNMFEAGVEGVKMRGKSDINEKTMLDVLIPALKSYKASLDNDEECKDAFKKAVDIAKERVEFTKTIIATKGRASYLGERSLGHIDPGAMSSFYIVEAIYLYFKGEN